MEFVKFRQPLGVQYVLILKAVASFEICLQPDDLVVERVSCFFRLLNMPFREIGS